MALGIKPRNAIRVYDPGYEDGEGAYIEIPRSMLATMGIPEGQPVRIQVRDEAPEQLVVLGPAAPRDPADPCTITATPEPHPSLDYPPRYSLPLPREWKEVHRRQPEEDMNDWLDDPYRMIEVEYDLEQSGRFLREDGTLVIPLDM